MSKHTNEELKDMAEHVVWEVNAFRNAARALARLTRGDEAWNRTLESVLLHFRILRGFFVDKPYSNNVLAQEYVPAWAPTREKVFEETKTALNKRLAHLTWDRVPWSSGNWDVAAMESAIEKVFGDFKKSLPESRAKWFSLSRLTVARGFGDSDGYSTTSGTFLGKLFE